MFDDGIKREPDNASRDECDNQFFDQFHGAKREASISENGQNSAELDDDLKAFDEFRVRDREKFSCEDHVACGGNGEKFSQAFHDADKDGLNDGHGFGDWGIGVGNGCGVLKVWIEVPFLILNVMSFYPLVVGRSNFPLSRMRWTGKL